MGRVAGRVDGYGEGSGYGYGYGDGSGYGYGEGSGYGYGYSSGYGYGDGSGYGYGDGYGDGSGCGYGYGQIVSGDGSGCGYGYGQIVSGDKWRIDAVMLEESGACADGVAAFKRLFPNGATYPTDWAKAKEAGLDVSWVRNLGLPGVAE